jgi:hypothetical protein
MVAVPLLAFVPAAAQAAGNDPGGYAVTAVRTALPADERQRARDPYQLPAEAVPQRLVSLPVSGDLNVGVGMFSIVGSTEKEMIRRRTEPATDVRTRDGRVAAVGLSLRF